MKKIDRRDIKETRKCLKMVDIYEEKIEVLTKEQEELSNRVKELEKQNEN